MPTEDTEARSDAQPKASVIVQDACARAMAVSAELNELADDASCPPTIAERELILAAFRDELYRDFRPVREGASS